LSTNGDTSCGGEDIDSILLNYLIEEFKKSSGIDISNNKKAVYRIKEASEKAKIELSTENSTKVKILDITADASGSKHLDIDLTKSKFESMIEDFIERTVKPCEDAIKNSNLSKNLIDEVILLGGSTKIPAV